MPKANAQIAALLEDAMLKWDIAFALRMAQLTVHEDLAGRLRPLELSLTQFSILRLIRARPTLSQQRIGDALRIKKSNLVALIDKLEELGLVTRAVAAEDRRAYALRLTRKGERRLEKAQQGYREHSEALDKLIASKQKNALLDALRKLTEIGPVGDVTPD